MRRSGMPEHTAPDLHAAARVVGYELRMLAHTALRTAQTHTMGADLDRNAYLESSLLHARQLADFLVHSKAGYPSDLRRTDFTPTDWKPGPADAVERIKDASPRFDKSLAHLTWERVHNDPPAWSFVQIARDLTAIADYWTAHLAQHDDALSTTLRPFVEAAQAVLRQPDQA